VGAVASVSEIKGLLLATTVPEAIIDELLDHASALWLMSSPASLLAGDLVLCYPTIGPEEVRAVAHPLSDGTVRLTVVARDRPGLLADTAGLLASQGLSVASASAMTSIGSDLAPELALHSLTIADCDLTQPGWDDLSARLRRLGQEGSPPVTFVPTGRAVVTSSPSGMGRSVVTVTAPDQVGLLWAVCRWFADHEVSIEAAYVGHSVGSVGSAGQVEDHFVVIGQPDARALAARLTVAPHSAFLSAGSLVGSAVGLAVSVGGLAGDLVGTMARGAARNMERLVPGP
jgi:glycine cleavage system regulatory protein